MQKLLLLIKMCFGASVQMIADARHHHTVCMILPLCKHAQLAACTNAPGISVHILVLAEKYTVKPVLNRQNKDLDDKW